MNRLVTDAEVVHLQSLYPLLDIPSFTGQEEQAIMYYLRGMTLAQAAEAAGYPRPTKFRNLLAKPGTQAVIQYFRDNMLEDVRIDRNKITGMILDSHSKAANTTEEMICIRELSKLHEISGEDRKAGAEADILENVKNEKQLSRLSNDQLLKLGGSKLKGLMEMPEPIDGEFEEIVDGKDPDS